MALMYYGTCQVDAVVPGKVPVKNMGGHGRVSRNFWMGSKTGTMAYTGIFHNIMAFMICTMWTWIYRMFTLVLHNGHADFKQWLGQLDPRRLVHGTCKGTKNR
jgi:hypothetical protein